MSQVPEFQERTSRLLQELGRAQTAEPQELLRTTVGITCRSEALGNPMADLLLSFSLNLLARTFTRVSLLPPLATEYLPQLEALFQRHWGFNLPELGLAEVTIDREPEVILAIGGLDEPTNAASVEGVGADGWVVRCRTGPGRVPVGRFPNAVGAAVASGLGVARIFAAGASRKGCRVLGLERPPEQLLSCYTLRSDAVSPSLPQEQVLDDVVLIGAGGVGSALVATLALMPKVSGRLTVVDPDALDVTNLNRFLPACRSAVGSPKVGLLAQFLSNRQTELRVLEAQMSYCGFVRCAGRPTGIVVSTVDNEAARAQIQSDLPRIVIDSATSGAVLGVSRHDFLHGACLGCLHPRARTVLADETRMAQVLGMAVGDVIGFMSDDRLLSPQELSLIYDKLGISTDSRIPPGGKSLRHLWAEDVCGRVVMPAGSGEKISGSAGFITLVAGALAAGELIKESTSGGTLDNQFMMQVFRGPSADFPRRREKDPMCSCYCSEEPLRAAYMRAHGLEVRPGESD